SRNVAGRLCCHVESPTKRCRQARNAEMFRRDEVRAVSRGFRLCRDKRMCEAECAENVAAEIALLTLVAMRQQKTRIDDGVREIWIRRGGGRLRHSPQRRVERVGLFIPSSVN